MSLLYGYLCTCTYPDDAPEDEGTVLFDHSPAIGDEFLLPSSAFAETWRVTSVDGEQGRIWAEQVHTSATPGQSQAV
jgi:hypothetical protein